MERDRHVKTGKRSPPHLPEDADGAGCFPNCYLAYQKMTLIHILLECTYNPGVSRILGNGHAV